MKRKIRRKRQLRIQQDKEQKRREKGMATTILFEERMCSRNEYASLANSPNYLYIYVRKHSGWSFYDSFTLAFLFDIERESVKYAVERDDKSYVSSSALEDNNDEFDPEQFLLSFVSETRVSLEIIGKAHFCIKDVIEEMFSWEEPNLPHIWDGGGWVVFLKNGKRKRWIYIQQAIYYPPFLWLLRFFDDVVELKKKGKKEQES